MIGCGRTVSQYPPTPPKNVGGSGGALSLKRWPGACLRTRGHQLYGSCAPPHAMTVPEPSTWAMLLLGFAGLGYAGYRRARESRAA
jgi:PEP-CTERM motif